MPLKGCLGNGRTNRASLSEGWEMRVANDMAFICRLGELLVRNMVLLQAMCVFSTLVTDFAKDVFDFPTKTRPATGFCHARAGFFEFLPFG